MKKINQLIVVEGKNDTARLKRYFDAETFETGGAGMSKEKLNYLKELAKKRELILFLDPDTPGENIRKRINDAIPGLKNAFVDKKEARTTKKVGVEHAEKEVLEKALASLLTYKEIKEGLNMQDLFELGLSGKNDASIKREKLSRVYPLGTCSGKTLLKRINMLGLSKEDIKEALNGKDRNKD